MDAFDSLEFGRVMSGEHSLLFVSDCPQGQCNPLMDALSRRHRCARQTPKSFSELRGSAASSWLGIIIDTDLNDALAIEQIKRGALQFDRNSTFFVVIVDPYGPLDLKMAMILRADRVIPRMFVNMSGIVRTPELRSVVDVASADFVRNGLEAIEWLIVKFSRPKTLLLALNAGEAALDSVFHLAKEKMPIDEGRLACQSTALCAGVVQHGLQQWLDTVRQHHNGTYRHSLAVAGIAGTFGRTLGFSRRDIERLTLAALLHDIGKAEVPVEILEKTGELTEQEQEILRLHPMRGRHMVEAQQGIDPEILDVISGHHEYLDGSGYPLGLHGPEISDLTRLMSICDCFANLISWRPPLAPNSNHVAFSLMCEMEGRLDMALVRAFEKVIVALDAEVESEALPA